MLAPRSLHWADQVGNTAMRRLDLMASGVPATLYLKDESTNPGGSIKDRTAVGLIMDKMQRGLIKPGSRLIESTSGNLGAAVACLARELQLDFTAVVDPKTTPANIEKMTAAGATIVCVDKPDPTGGYLLTRLAYINECVAADPGLVWLNQYESLANPQQHYVTTAPEIWMQMRGRIDVVYIAVSTGGTLGGISRFIRRVSPRTKIVAVDANGSIALGGLPGKRFLTGIGASRRSSFLSSDDYAKVVYVSDAEAFGTCRALQAAGLSFGGSAGAAIHAAMLGLQARPTDIAVVLCPDGGANYADTIFSDSWIAAHLPAARESEVKVAALLNAPRVDNVFPFNAARNAS